MTTMQGKFEMTWKEQKSNPFLRYFLTFVTASLNLFKSSESPNNMNDCKSKEKIKKLYKM